MKKVNNSDSLSVYSFPRLIWRPLRYTSLHRLIFRRRFHALCVGTPKSGTHSIAHLFSTNYRAAHEPDSSEFIRQLLFKHTQNHDFIQFLRHRDRQLWLEMEASHYLVNAIDKIVEEFPHIKIILTIRDCYSWVNSLINQFIRTTRATYNQHWFDLHDFYYSYPKQVFSPKEQSLSKLIGVYPLDNLFAFWHRHNSYVLDAVPPDRLLVIRTNEIQSQKTQQKLSSFLEIDSKFIPIERAFSGKAPKYEFDLFAEVEHEFIETLARQYCTHLMSSFFPEINSISDVLSQ